MADIVKKCKDCNDEFTITEDEKKWFEEKGLHLPERCGGCRKRRKDEKSQGGKR